MKNRGVNLLLAVTLLFVGITIGFALGRSLNRAPVTLSVVSQAEETVPSTAPTTASTPGTAEPASLQQTAPPEESTQSYTSPVNINTADLNTLMTLPGIGEVLAQRIIDYRQTNGEFQALEELTNVDGIGTKRLEAILDYATTGG